MPEFVTERQGRKQWCPQVQVAIYIDAKGTMWATTSRGETSRIEDLPAMTRCIGPDCGAWEAGPDVEKTEGTIADKVDALGRVRLVPTGRCGLKK